MLEETPKKINSNVLMKKQTTDGEMEVVEILSAAGGAESGTRKIETSANLTNSTLPRRASDIKINLKKSNVKPGRRDAPQGPPKSVASPTPEPQYPTKWTDIDPDYQYYDGKESTDSPFTKLCADYRNEHVGKFMALSGVPAYRSREILVHMDSVMKDNGIQVERNVLEKELEDGAMYTMPSSVSSTLTIEIPRTFFSLEGFTPTVECDEGV